jgi:maltooligosyltrehalose trehalohydrolase
MLFQGEEWAASTPFQFFTSHPEPELGRATAEGRITEFERMGWDPAVVPDPQDPETFTRSKLDWAEATGGRHARVLEGYRELARLRRALPGLTDPAFGSVACEVDEERRVFRMRRRDLEVVVNFGEEEHAADTAAGVLHFATGIGVTLDAGVLRLPPHAAALVGP